MDYLEYMLMSHTLSLDEQAIRNAARDLRNLYLCGKDPNQYIDIVFNNYHINEDDLTKEQVDYIHAAVVFGRY